MNTKLQRVLGQLIPLLILGFTIAFFIGLLVVFSYLLLWGFIIGATLWVALLIKSYLFPKPSPKKSSGRIIEHDEKD